ASDYQFMKGQVAAGAPTVGQYNYLNMNFGLCRILLSVINGNLSKNETFPFFVNIRDAAWDYVTINAYKEYVQDHVFAPAGVSGATLDHPAADALAYNFPTSGKGWNSGDLSTMAGGAAWHLSVNHGAVGGDAAGAAQDLDRHAHVVRVGQVEAARAEGGL